MNLTTQDEQVACFQNVAALRERWSDWNRAPFTNDSTMHVSVWEKTPSPRPVRRGLR
jgi:hypothetical protein